MFNTSTSEHLSEQQKHHRFNEFMAEVAAIEDRPPGGCVEVAEFMKTSEYLLSSGREQLPRYYDLVTSYIYNRTDLNSNAAAQMLWRTFQYSLTYSILPTPPEILERRLLYPDGHQSSGAWLKTIEKLIANPSFFLEIEENLSIRHNQSTQPDRYIGLSLTIPLLRSIIGEHPTLVEAGCSSGIGLAKLKHNKPYNNYRFDADPVVAQRMHQTLATELVLGSTVAFDLHPIDYGAELWIAAMDYPSELRSASKIVERQMLLDSRDAMPLQADITKDDRNLQNVRDHLPNGKANIAAAITTFHLIAPEKRDQASILLTSLSSDVVIWQDFCDVNRDDPTKLVFSHPNDPAMKYRLLLKHSNGDGTIEKLLTFSDGRAEEVHPEPAYITLQEAAA